MNSVMEKIGILKPRRPCLLYTSQKQRLTIARALVGDPQILILDDSSSALDFATDAALRRAIRQETQNMTVLIVTQRASAIKQEMCIRDSRFPAHNKRSSQFSGRQSSPQYSRKARLV